MISYFKEIVFLYKANKDINWLKKYIRDKYPLGGRRYAEQFIRFSKWAKAPWRRNALAGIIKKLRVEYPYQPIDYSDARTVYENYFKMHRHIESREQLQKLVDELGCVFLYQFRDEYAVKGGDQDPYNCYHIGKYYGWGKEGKDSKVYMIDQEDMKYDFPGDKMGCFIFATKEQVMQYYQERIRQNRTRYWSMVETMQQIDEELEELESDRDYFLGQPSIKKYL